MKTQILLLIFLWSLSGCAAPGEAGDSNERGQSGPQFTAFNAIYSAPDARLELDFPGDRTLAIGPSGELVDAWAIQVNFDGPLYDAQGRILLYPDFSFLREEFSCFFGSCNHTSIGWFDAGGPPPGGLFWPLQTKQQFLPAASTQVVSLQTTDGNISRLPSASLRSVFFNSEATYEYASQPVPTSLSIQGTAHRVTLTEYTAGRALDVKDARASAISTTAPGTPFERIPTEKSPWPFMNQSPEQAIEIMQDLSPEFAQAWSTSCLVEYATGTRQGSSDYVPGEGDEALGLNTKSTKHYVTLFADGKTTRWVVTYNDHPAPVRDEFFVDSEDPVPGESTCALERRATPNVVAPDAIEAWRSKHLAEYLSISTSFGYAPAEPLERFDLANGQVFTLAFNVPNPQGVSAPYSIQWWGPTGHLIQAILPPTVLAELDEGSQFPWFSPPN